MAVTLTPGSNHGALNGTTPVTIVAAPSSGVTRIVRSIKFANKDSAAVDIRIRKIVGASTYEFDSALALAVDSKFYPVDGPDLLVLSGTDQSITALMGGAAATTNPPFIASYIDRTVT